MPVRTDHCLRWCKTHEEKDDGGLNSSVLQNPSDPDATYRVKAGKVCRGYAANIAESVSNAGSIVTDYQYEQSIYSGSQFLKDNYDIIVKYT
ncbi:MAG TPA: hypothetical protein DCZ23_00300, partial [Lachnospiraceae bacterium]|nr:hypothetical protein [Lachnospiraceae bacterium]